MIEGNLFEGEAMKKNRHTPIEKAKLVLEALRGERSVNEIASEHGIHPSMLSRWKREAEENLHTLFKNDSAQKRREQREHEAEKSELYAKIGELTTHVEWLKKKSGL